MVKPYQTLYPRQIILVVSKGNRPNVMTAAWATPTSFEPFLVAISIGKERYSHDLIKKTKEFVIAVPDISMKDKVLSCGEHSGQDTDKFKEVGLTPIPAKNISVPLIKECQINLECQLVDDIETGDHTLFIGKVLAIHGKKTKPCIVDVGGREFIGV